MFEYVSDSLDAGAFFSHATDSGNTCCVFFGRKVLPSLCVKVALGGEG